MANSSTTANTAMAVVDFYNNNNNTPRPVVTGCTNINIIQPIMK